MSLSWTTNIIQTSFPVPPQSGFRLFLTHCDSEIDEQQQNTPPCNLQQRDLHDKKTTVCCHNRHTWSGWSKVWRNIASTIARSASRHYSHVICIFPVVLYCPAVCLAILVTPGSRRKLSWVGMLRPFPSLARPCCFHRNIGMDLRIFVSSVSVFIITERETRPFCVHWWCIAVFVIVQ